MDERICEPWGEGEKQENGEKGYLYHSFLLVPVVREYLEYPNEKRAKSELCKASKYGYGRGIALFSSRITAIGIHSPVIT